MHNSFAVDHALSWKHITASEIEDGKIENKVQNVLAY
jgi:hypothetical protein